MDELFDFLRTEHDSKYDLIKIALAHHRFAWIHPFHNGNGRVVRLFTYALLIERGFNVRQGRVLNPSAVFCMNRDRYYDIKWTPLSRHKFTENKVESFPVLPIYYPSPLS
jgi:Fic family protein